MKKTVIISGAGVLVAAAVVAVFVLNRGLAPEVREQESEVRNQPSSLAARHLTPVTQQALESPEEFQVQAAENRTGPVPLVVPTNRPVQLSEVDKPAIGNHQSAMQKEPVAVKDLYFWQDYQSLRKDEIRNPDSEANRQGVVALLQARQRRAGQD